MVDDGVVRVVRNPQTQQASRGEAVINDDCWDFENMGSHLQVTHIDGTVRNVDRDALGTTISSESGRIWLLMLAQSLAITAAFLGWVAPGNTSVLFHTDLPQTDKFMGSSIGFLLLGRLSDLYGRRHFIVGTSLLGVVGCLLGSFAVNAEMLIAANICNGMAAAAQLPLGVAVAELVPNKDRARTVAGTLVLPFLVAGLGSAIIPSLLDDGSPQLNVAGKTKLEMIKHLDFVGIFLYVSGCVLLPLGFCLGISSYPSVSKEVIGTLVGGFSALVLFVIYEAFSTAEQPLMPPKMFKNVQFASLVACATFSSMVFYALTVLWPFVIGKVFNKDSNTVAWSASLLPFGATLGIALTAVPSLRGERFRKQCMVASGVALALMAPLCTIWFDIRHGLIVLAGICASFALGHIVAVAITGVTLVWEPQDIGLASGVLGSMCSLGCAFARALVTLLLRKKLEEELTKSVTPVVLDAILPGPILKQLATTIREQATMNGKTNLTAFTSVSILSRFAITNAIQAGYSYSLRSIFLAIIPFSAILLIAACFVPNLDQFNTLKVARRLQGPDGNAPQNDEEAAEEPGLELSMLGRPVSAADVI
ncbi:trichothecene efflux pump [Colletotrichum abscissum]|uniref:Trichothecene efflux pump n=1 Tax=Colletotrichum abscissum TaxID=1671311 RepID=A0A9P9XBL1_9PEZI|nr:trichothecene efflux pump [Colletotrichum abscissum]KAI3546985.1 trichothecene efflux pump [Colletotrichum abscissum]KAK1498876.1 trichothecene efflux pump [Colletotrichum abscissum]